MTNIGYDYIIQLIREREVEVPPMRADQAVMWWCGWKTCQEQILLLIEKLKRDNDQGR